MCIASCRTGPGSCGWRPRTACSAMMARFAGFYTAQGLPSNRVLSLHQSTDGTLWSGTREGLVRFERDHVAAVALPERVGFLGDSSLASDVSGRLYAGTNRRLWAVESLRDEAIFGRIPGGQNQGLRCSKGSERRVWFGCSMTRLPIPERKSVLGRKARGSERHLERHPPGPRGKSVDPQFHAAHDPKQVGRQFSEVCNIPEASTPAAYICRSTERFWCPPVMG